MINIQLILYSGSVPTFLTEKLLRYWAVKMKRRQISDIALGLMTITIRPVQYHWLK